MKIALTNKVSDKINQCELTHAQRQVIDVAKAREQHAAYCDWLADCGCRVVKLAINQDNPDGVFVEDTTVVVDELAVMTTMGVASRQNEVEAMAEVLAKYKPIHRLQAPASIEGGDVARVGKKFFVGLSSRTNPAGVAALAAALEPHGYTVTGVPVTGILHLKSAVSELDEETILINPTMIDPTALKGFKWVEVPAEEPKACNILKFGNRIGIFTDYPRTAEKLAGLGYEINPIDMSELIKAESGLTCSSVIFNHNGPEVD